MFMQSPAATPGGIRADFGATAVFATLLALAPVGHACAADRDGINILYTPMNATDTYLVDGSGNIVHTWSSAYPPGLAAYLQDDGSIIRAGSINRVAPQNPFVAFETRGEGKAFNVGGIVERIAKDSSVVWSINYYGDTFAPHHDVLVLPNGNLMMPVWRAVTEEQAIALGRSPDQVGSDGLWLDSIVELQVSGTDDYTVVWQWNSADHLVQDVDPARANYGALAENPQLININYDDGKPPNNPDIMHVNSVIYIPEFDQIVINSLNYSELWVIDHSTTTAEAAGHTGGRYGKGGDILYRWGNPTVYGKGDADVFNLSGVHDANWVAADRQIIMFDNNSMSRGRHYPGGNAKLVVINPPLSADGTYELPPDQVFGPVHPVLAADLGFEEPSLGSVAKLADGSYFACHCNQAQGLFLDATGKVVKTLDLTKNIGGPPGSSFRLTPYDDGDPGVVALR